jgi:cathepsin F
MLDAYEYTKTHGLIKEGDYPTRYAGRKEACKDIAGKEAIKNDNEKEEDSITVQRMKELVMAQPMGVAMHSNPKCLMGYHSGVIRESDCSCSHAETATVNHAVTLVGYGKNTQNNQDECPEYWKIRNSWGANWGEEGYFKLCIPKDSTKLPTGTCQVLSYVQYPLFN